MTREVHFLGRSVLEHRLIFALCHGYWPEGQVDHKDRNPQNNWIDNLQEASNLDNSRNASMSVLNTSGQTGVTWHKGGSKWLAQITVKGKNVYLGLHAEYDDAVAARKAAEIKFGFAPGHGTPH